MSLVSLLVGKFISSLEAELIVHEPEVQAAALNELAQLADKLGEFIKNKIHLIESKK